LPSAARGIALPAAAGRAWVAAGRAAGAWPAAHAVNVAAATMAAAVTNVRLPDGLIVTA